MTRARRPVAALVVPVALCAVLAGCSGGTSAAGAAGSGAAGGATQAAPPATSTPTPTSTATGTGGAAADLGQVVTITVAGGKVSGPSGRVKVRLGSTVTLRVTSDVADEVHLHGYDKHVDVAQGGTADLTFTADTPGVFEVELESRALQLAQLQVQ